MENTILTIENLYAGYGDVWVVKDVSLTVSEQTVLAIMGPSGCGKTTLIRCINRMHEVNRTASHKGKIIIDGENIFDINPILVRRKIGMVFQRPNPFPTMNIYNNVLAGYILNGIKLRKDEKDEIVEKSLKQAYLWDEVKDSLYKKGTFLSGGQQQRLCIARALAMRPEILLLDEPTSALDPKASSMIEELIIELKKDVTIVIVTHNTSQAARVSDMTAFMYLGELIEYGPTEKLFTVPKDARTEEYLTGKFG